MPISINDIENVIENLNNAGFDDFDSMLNAVRNHSEHSFKWLATAAFNSLDHDRNNKIEKNDINQKWKEIKQAAQEHFTPRDIKTIDESPEVTALHLLSLLPLYIAGKYLGFFY